MHYSGNLQPVLHIHAVTFRNNPILPICVAGLPPEENHTIWGTMISAQLLELCLQAGLPVDMAWCSYEAATYWAVLSVDPAALAKLNTTADAFVKHVSDVLFNSHAGYLIPKLILVSNDIDITNIEEVVCALATRYHPKFDHHSLPEVREFPMVPYLNQDDKERGCAGKAIINCLFPEQSEGKMRTTTALFKHS